jgi:hypothetical protein
LRQAQKCGGAKRVKSLPTLVKLYICRNFAFLRRSMSERYFTWPVYYLSCFHHECVYSCWFFNKNKFFIVHFDKYYFISYFTKANLLETKRKRVDRYNIGIYISLSMYICRHIRLSHDKILLTFFSSKIRFIHNKPHWFLS